MERGWVHEHHADGEGGEARAVLRAKQREQEQAREQEGGVRQDQRSETGVVERDCEPAERDRQQWELPDRAPRARRVRMQAVAVDRHVGIEIRVPASGHGVEHDVVGVAQHLPGMRGDRRQQRGSGGKRGEQQRARDDEQAERPQVLARARHAIASQLSGAGDAQCDQQRGDHPLQQVQRAARGLARQRDEALPVERRREVGIDRQRARERCLGPCQ
jgi:hypothetical protein